MSNSEKNSPILTDEDQALLDWLHSADLSFDRTTIESMGALEEEHPSAVANLLTFIICKCFHLDSQDSLKLKAKDLAPMLHLQAFLMNWGHAKNAKDKLVKQLQEETAFAEEGL